MQQQEFATHHTRGVVDGSLRPNELIVDLFAGGGGASCGIYAATGRHPDIAVNHSDTAITMHRANHPTSTHYIEDVFAINPQEVCAESSVGLLWLSPDCTHFSRAKGKAPKQKNTRSLANVAIRWATEVRPRVIILENVEEFVTWGPLNDEGQPIKARSGEDFARWKAALNALGYVIEHRLLVAADYGAPTKRKRLFLVARCDGLPIQWPEPSHGVGRAKPWRTAAEVIDFELHVPSIFGRKKELADATKKRIAEGVRRYVLRTSKPFIIPVTHQGAVRVHNLDEPFRTITAANRGELALVAPFISSQYGQSIGSGIEEPVPTVTAGGGGHQAVVTPFITKFYGTGTGIPIDEPLHTVTAGGHHFGLVVPTLIQTGFGERKGQAPRVPGLHKPLGTVVAGAAKHAVVTAFLVKHYGGVVGHDLDRPIGTVTSKDHHALVTSTLVEREDRSEDVMRFLAEWCKGDMTPGNGLVGPRGEGIIDIGMRMLTPDELFRAQSLPDDYLIAIDHNGKPMTKTAQTELAGNSVCPPLAEAVVRANVGWKGRTR